MCRSSGLRAFNLSLVNCSVCLLLHQAGLCYQVFQQVASIFPVNVHVFCESCLCFLFLNMKTIKSDLKNNGDAQVLSQPAATVHGSFILVMCLVLAVTRDKLPSKQASNHKAMIHTPKKHGSKAKLHQSSRYCRGCSRCQPNAPD